MQLCSKGVSFSLVIVGLNIDQSFFVLSVGQLFKMQM